MTLREKAKRYTELQTEIDNKTTIFHRLMILQQNTDMLQRMLNAPVVALLDKILPELPKSIQEELSTHPCISRALRRQNQIYLSSGLCFSPSGSFKEVIFCSTKASTRNKVLGNYYDKEPINNVQLLTFLSTLTDNFWNWPTLSAPIDYPPILESLQKKLEELKTRMTNELGDL